MRELTIKLHETAVDGLPDMEKLTGRVAFLWDGNLISGWPAGDGQSPWGSRWEPAEDRFGGPCHGVTHWVELPEPAWQLVQPRESPGPRGVAVQVLARDLDQLIMFARKWAELDRNDTETLEELLVSLSENP